MDTSLHFVLCPSAVDNTFNPAYIKYPSPERHKFIIVVAREKDADQYLCRLSDDNTYILCYPHIKKSIHSQTPVKRFDLVGGTYYLSRQPQVYYTFCVERPVDGKGFNALDTEKGEKKEPILLVSQSDYIDKIANMFTRQVPWPHRVIFLVNRYVSRDTVISELANNGKFLEEWRSILYKGTKQQCIQVIRNLAKDLQRLSKSYGFVVPRENNEDNEEQKEPEELTGNALAEKEAYYNIRSFLYYVIVTSSEPNRKNDTDGKSNDSSSSSSSTSTTAATTTTTNNNNNNNNGNITGDKKNINGKITTTEYTDLILPHVSASELSYLINPENIKNAKIGNGISEDPTGNLQQKLAIDISNYMGRHGSGAVLPYVINQIENALNEVKQTDQKIAALPHKPITSLNTTSTVIKTPEYYRLIKQQYTALDTLKANIGILYIIMKNNYTVIRGLSCHIADAESRITKGMKDGKYGGATDSIGTRSKTETLIYETFGVPSNAIMLSIRNLIIMLSQDILFREIFWEVGLLWKMEKTLNNKKWAPIKEQIRRSEAIIENERHGILSEKDKKQANTERLAAQAAIRTKKEELAKERDTLRRQIGLIFRSVIPYHWATGITGNMEEDISLLAISVRGIGANNIAPVMSPQTAGLFLFCKLIRNGETNAILAALRIPPTSVSTLSLDIHYSSGGNVPAEVRNANNKDATSGDNAYDEDNEDNEGDNGNGNIGSPSSTSNRRNIASSRSEDDKGGEIQRTILSKKIPPSIDPYNLEKLLISPEMLRSSAPAFGLDIFEAIKQDLASLILTDVDPITNSLISYITNFLMFTKHKKTTIDNEGVIHTEEASGPVNPKVSFTPLIINSLYICQALDVLESRGFTRTSLYLLAIYMRRLFIPKAFKTGSSMGPPHPPFFTFRECTLICTAFVNIARLVARLTSKCVFHALTIFANTIDLILRESAKFRLSLDSCDRIREKSNRDERRNLFSFTVITSDGRNTGISNANQVFGRKVRGGTQTSNLAGGGMGSQPQVKQDNSISWRAFLVSFVDDYILTTNLECNIVLLALNICLPESRNIGNNTIPRDHPAWHPLSDALNVSAGSGAGTNNATGPNIVNSKMPLSREDLDMWRTLYTAAISCMYKKVFTTSISAGSNLNMNSDWSATSNSIACSLSHYFKGYSNIIGIPTPKTYPLLLGLETLLCVPNPLVGRKVSWLLKTYGFTHRWDVIYGYDTCLNYSQYNINNAEGIDTRLANTNPNDDSDLGRSGANNIYISYVENIYNNILKAMNYRVKETNTIYPNKTSSLQFCTTTSGLSALSSSSGSSNTGTTPEIDITYISDPLFCLSYFSDVIPTYQPISEFDIICKHSLYGSFFALEKLREVPNYSLTEMDKITQKDVSYVTNNVSYIINTYNVKNILSSRGFLYPKYVSPILRLLSSRPNLCNVSSGGIKSQGLNDDDNGAGMLVGIRESLLHSLLNAGKSANLVVGDLLSHNRVSIGMVENYFIRGPRLSSFTSFIQKAKSIIETPGALQKDPYLFEFVENNGQQMTYHSILYGLSETLDLPGQRHSLQAPVLELVILNHGFNDILCNGLFGTFAQFHKDNFYYIPTGSDTINGAQGRVSGVMGTGKVMGYSLNLKTIVSVTSEENSSSNDNSLNVGKHYSTPCRPTISPEISEASVAILENNNRGDIITSWLSAAITMYCFNNGVYIPTQPIIKDSPKADNSTNLNNIKPLGLQELLPMFTQSMAKSVLICVQALQRMHEFCARPIVDAFKSNGNARSIVDVIGSGLKGISMQSTLGGEFQKLSTELNLKLVDAEYIKSHALLSGFLVYQSRKASGKKFYWAIHGTCMYGFKDIKDSTCRMVVVLTGARFHDEGIQRKPKGNVLRFRVEQALQFDENNDGPIYFECDNTEATWPTVIRDHIVSLICPITPTYSK